MRWLKRGLWMTAWGAWLALGVGLYQQLPRAFGQPLCTLPVDQSALPSLVLGPMGFVGDGNIFAVESTPRNGQKGWQVRLFDAQTGSELESRPMPELGPGPIWKLGRPRDRNEPFREMLRRG